MAKKRSKRSSGAPRTGAPKEPAQISTTPPSAPEPPASARASWFVRAVIALAALAAFARGVGHPLLDGWDDDRFLRDNPLVHEVSWPNFVAIVASPRFEAYQPLHLLAYWLDVPWAGPSGPVVHAVNLGVWLAALLILFEALRAWRLPWFACLAAVLIVGVHPVQVEAVTWATGRKDVLALLFASAAIALHARSERAWDARAWGSRACFVAACLAKTSAVGLPIVLVAGDVLLLGREWRRALIAQVPALAIAFGLAALHYTIFEGAQMVRAPSLGERLALIGATVTHHLATAFWPSSLSPVYPIAEDFRAFQVLAGAMVLALASVLAARLRAPRLAFVVIAFVALIAPASNVIPLYFQWQDRYLSLPLVPIAILVGSIAAAIFERSRPFASVALAVLVVALGIRTADYAGVWRDRRTLFAHAASVQPRAFYAWLNLGHARRDAGDLQGAIDAYSRAIEVQNLAIGHDARFYALMRLDERERSLPTSSPDDARIGRYHAGIEDPRALRQLAGELARAGYRRAVALVLDQSFALEPLPDEQLQRAALIQLELGNEWLADYYVSRLRREPVAPALRERLRAVEEREAD